MLAHSLDRIRTPWLALGLGLLLVAAPSVLRADDSEDKAPPAKQERAKESPAKPQPTGGKRIEPHTAPAKSPFMAAARANQKPAESALVFDNDDLEARYGPVEEAPASPVQAEANNAEGKDAAKGKDAAEGKEAADPLKSMEEEQAAAKEQRERVAAAQKNLSAARQEVTRLEKQMLAIKNPFSARPDLSDEEKEARAKSAESAPELLARTQKQLDEARQKLAEAEKELTDSRGAIR